MKNNLINSLYIIILSLLLTVISVSVQLLCCSCGPGLKDILFVYNKYSMALNSMRM